MSIQEIIDTRKDRELYWLDKIKEFYDNFGNKSGIPDRYDWEKSEEYYLRLKNYEAFDKCNKCTEHFWKMTEYALKSSQNLIFKQECKCKAE